MSTARLKLGTIAHVGVSRSESYCIVLGGDAEAAPPEYDVDIATSLPGIGITHLLHFSTLSREIEDWLVANGAHGRLELHLINDSKDETARGG